jgi:hypothetical protein
MWIFFQIKKTDEPPHGSDSESDYSNVASPFDHIAVYKQMLELMMPGESVAKSLRRLGEFIATVSMLSLHYFLPSCFFNVIRFKRHMEVYKKS